MKYEKGILTYVGTAHATRRRPPNPATSAWVMADKIAVLLIGQRYNTDRLRANHFAFHVRCYTLPNASHRARSAAMATVEKLRRTLYVLTILFIINTLVYVVLVNFGNDNLVWILLVYCNFGVILLFMLTTTVSLRLASARQEARQQALLQRLAQQAQQQQRQRRQQQQQERERAGRPQVVMVLERTRTIVPPGLSNRADLPPAYSPPGSEPPPPYLQTETGSQPAPAQETAPVHTQLTIIEGPPRSDDGAADRSRPPTPASARPQQAWTSAAIQPSLHLKGWLARSTMDLRAERRGDWTVIVDSDRCDSMKISGELSCEMAYRPSDLIMQPVNQPLYDSVTVRRWLRYLMLGIACFTHGLATCQWFTYQINKSSLLAMYWSSLYLLLSAFLEQKWITHR